MKINIYIHSHHFKFKKFTVFPGIYVTFLDEASVSAIYLAVSILLISIIAENIC